MAYAKKTWLQRIVSLPGRRRLTSTGTEDVYDMSRAEGEIIQEGDAWSAANMNDMEDRIESGLEEKLDVTKVVEDLNVTEEGYALGAKTASDKFGEINDSLSNLPKKIACGRVDLNLTPADLNIEKTFTADISSYGFTRTPQVFLTNLSGGYTSKHFSQVRYSQTSAKQITINVIATGSTADAAPYFHAVEWMAVGD